MYANSKKAISVSVVAVHVYPTYFAEHARYKFQSWVSSNMYNFNNCKRSNVYINLLSKYNFEKNTLKLIIAVSENA